MNIQMNNKEGMTAEKPTDASGLIKLSDFRKSIKYLRENPQGFSYFF